MSLLRRRAPHRSCRVHGDNGCEIQGEAGLRERYHDKRVWRAEAEQEARDTLDDVWGVCLPGCSCEAAADEADRLRAPC